MSQTHDEIKQAFESYIAESEAFGNCFGTDNFVQGIQAFLHRRKPKF